MICMFSGQGEVIFCIEAATDARKARNTAPFAQFYAGLPDVVGDIHHQTQLGPLLLFGQAVALFR